MKTTQFCQNFKHVIAQPTHASWIELDKSAFITNAQTYKNILGTNTLLGAILKGNAYGHGLSAILPIVYEAPVDVLFFINPHDALYIREFEMEYHLTSKRIIVMGALAPNEVLECARKNIEVTLGNEQYSEKNYLEILKENLLFDKNKNPIKIHLHLDTGLSREGIYLDNLEHILPVLQNSKEMIEVKGVMTHLARADNDEHTKHQSKLFELGFEKIIEYLKPDYQIEKHIGQSTASLFLPTQNYNIARVGISIYGHWQSSDIKQLVDKQFASKLPLSPVLRWKVRSQTVQEIPKGSFIGYDCTYCTERFTRIALLPVGYYDGYPRLLSNRGHVLVNGKRCNILGRVMMNYIVIDVTDATENCESVEATLIGTNGNEVITAEMIADWAQTIQYEVLTQIGAHLKRTVV